MERRHYPSIYKGIQGIKKRKRLYISSLKPKSQSCISIDFSCDKLNPPLSVNIPHPRTKRIGILSYLVRISKIIIRFKAFF